MGLWEISFVGGLLLIGVMWLEGMRAKEIASNAGRRACRRAGVTFLDDTVVLQKTRVRRAASGQLVLARLFYFEFASDGQTRFDGAIIMLGRQVSETLLDPAGTRREREVIDVPGSETPLEGPP